MRRPVFIRFALVAACAVLGSSCSHRVPTEAWPPITDPVVFGDTFGANVIWQAFSGSKLNALAIDSTTSYTGAASLEITVPNPGDASGTYAGGAFTTTRLRDLAVYNAVSFWVKASRAASLDVAGLGNDNTGTSRFTAQRAAIPMTTSWTQVLVPIPNPARLTAEGGLFFFAEGPQAGSGLTFWIDDVEFVNTPVITNPRPALSPQSVNSIVGASVDLSNDCRTVFAVSGLDQTVTHLPGYFDFHSTLTGFGRLSGSRFDVLEGGIDTLTASLAGVAASGAIVISSIAPPLAAAPLPTLPAANVRSLLGSAYPSIPVDTWSASWDVADETDLSIAGSPTKLYTNVSYAGIECTSHPIDATSMTAFHLDVWIPSGTTFKVKLVDFGANGVYGGGDDSQSELTYTTTSQPSGFVTGQWVPLEIPLVNFTALLARAHIAQIILSGDTPTVFVENMYFHD